MRHENNMYNPSSPGACWVMECQECFGAVLITGILDYPLINRPVAKITQSPKGCVCFCDVFVFLIFFLIIETIATYGHNPFFFFFLTLPYGYSMNGTHIHWRFSFTSL